MKVRNTAVVIGVAIGLVALAVAFVIAQSDAHRFDRSLYGVTKDPEGDLAVVVSPCSQLGIGFVTVGVLSEGDEPEIVFSAEISGTGFASDEVVLARPPTSYVASGSPPDDDSQAVIWNLRRADGGNLLPSPLEFVPSEISQAEVLTGEGAVDKADWNAC